MEVFACLGGTDVRVAVEADPDETVASLQAKAVSCLRAEGQVLEADAVWLRVPGSADALGSGDTRLEHTPLQHGDTVEVVVGCKAGASDAFGGGGGTAFNDSTLTVLWGRVVRIDIELSAAPGLPSITGLSLTYANGVRVPHASGTNRTICVTLDDDEHVTGVKGWAGHSLHQIVFMTNKRDCGPHGRHDPRESREFSVDFGLGNQLLYFYGSASPTGHQQIGFGFGTPVDVPPVLRTALHGRTRSRIEDDDSLDCVHLRARVCGISVWVMYGFVREVGVAYTDGTFRHHGCFQMGSSYVVAFDDDEFVTRVDGVAWDMGLTQVTFTTNKRTVGPFGTASRNDTQTFSETFSGQMLFVCSHSRLFLYSLGFGHGQPAERESTDRALSKREVEWAMRQCEEGRRAGTSTRSRVSNLQDYLPMPTDYQPNTGCVVHTPEPCCRPAATTAGPQDDSCGCTVC